MNRTIGLVLCLSALGAAHAGAQATASTPKAMLDASQQKFVGLWEGSYSAHGSSGGYRLEIAHDSAWKVRSDFVAEQPITSQGTDFKVNGNTATWKQALMGESCTTSATLEGAQLKGETTCSQMTFPFQLRKTQ